MQIVLGAGFDRILKITRKSEIFLTLEVVTSKMSKKVSKMKEFL